MSVTVKILISLAIGVIAATIISVIFTGAMLEPVILLGCAAACLCSALVGNAGGSSAAQASRPEATQPRPLKNGRSDTAAGEVAAATGEREYGKVKWFNVSKGFGFIVRENGEEIFVHFRSIRSNGRRGLRDGQSVSYVVVDSDKGPQAEDVEAHSAD